MKTIAMTLMAALLTLILSSNIAQAKDPVTDEADELIRPMSCQFSPANCNLQ